MTAKGPYSVNPGMKVPNGPLREVFLRSGMSATEIAHRLHWYAGKYSNGNAKADSNRVKRTLGINRDVSVSRHGRRYWSRRELVDVEIVERIADVIGIPAWEVLPDDDR